MGVISHSSQTWLDVSFDTGSLKVVTDEDYRRASAWLGAGLRVVLVNERKEPLVLMTQALWQELERQ